MDTTDAWIDQLCRERDKAAALAKHYAGIVEHYNAVITALHLDAPLQLSSPSEQGQKAKASASRGRLSAEARQRIAAAQTKRWAEFRRRKAAEG